MIHEKTILLIAGSDSSSNAGIQSDIKTSQNLKTYCTTTITCITAQNTQKVEDIFYLPADFVKKQILTILDDIKIDVIKIGMLGNGEIITSITKTLKQKAKNIPIIFDPIINSTSKNPLLQKNALPLLKKNLIPLSFLITPNANEAEILSGIKISSFNDVKIAAKEIIKLGVENVLIKGAHLEGSEIKHLLLNKNNQETIFTNPRIGSEEIRGTGCSLSTSIACFLAHDYGLEDSIEKANQYVLKQIKAAKKIGKGNLVMGHGCW